MPSVRLKLRRTKIVATIGPVSRSPEKIRELIGAGVNVFRLNFSHGTHEDHRLAMARIRMVAAELDKCVAILGDLCGPKIRVGLFEGDQIPLETGQEVVITTEDVVGRPGLIPTQYAHLIKDVSPGQSILLDDGRLEIEIVSITSPARARARVVRGGVLKNRKGMNLPGTPLSIPALTEKDRRDLRFCVAQDIDYVALSFVRRADEVEELKSLIAAWTNEIHPCRPDAEQALIQVISKIEKPEAFSQIEAIVDASDGIMIARGDLGVELPAEKVPIYQNQLIELANQKRKAVIVATQMMESMVTESRPTRAEVSDVANAVFAHTDAVMLSAETASGSFPVEAVTMMDAVLREVEGHQWLRGRFGDLQADAHIYDQTMAIARAATMLSKDLEIRALNIITNSGATAKTLSATRPNAPLLAYCPKGKVARQLCLYWGVVPVYLKADELGDAFVQKVNDLMKSKGVAQPGQLALIVSGSHTDPHSDSVQAISLHPVT